jgi:Ion channel
MNHNSLLKAPVKICNFLIKVPALIYLIGYVGLIFIFAFLYTLLPNNSFYHATAKYEKNDLNNEATIILGKINDEIKANFKNKYNSSIATINGWMVDSNKFSTHSLDAKNYPEDISFNLRYELGLDNGTKILGEGYKIKITFKDIVASEDIVCLPFQTRQRNEIPIPGIPKLPNITSIIVKNPNSIVLVDEYFSFPRDLYDEILSFGKAYLGFPSEIRNHYSRMLYFSASLATSNGLGDIVPISNLARLLVTIESIVMLILIALFLSSLADKLATRKS